MFTYLKLLLWNILRLNSGMSPTPRCVGLWSYWFVHKHRALLGETTCASVCSFLGSVPDSVTTDISQLSKWRQHEGKTRVLSLPLCFPEPNKVRLIHWPLHYYCLPPWRTRWTRASMTSTEGFANYITSYQSHRALGWVVQEGCKFY